MIQVRFVLCVNTYFDTICVHLLENAYILSKICAVKSVKKLDFIKYIQYLLLYHYKFPTLIFPITSTTALCANINTIGVFIIHPIVFYSRNQFAFFIIAIFTGVYCFA